jgi:hypothetical protein
LAKNLILAFFSQRISAKKSEKFLKKKNRESKTKTTLRNGQKSISCIEGAENKTGF